ncbi:hypothetical protein GTA08_BOTSDO08426 [Botryosphaeria dothidea]|uniref:Uncharacterized protein n=1 Tax=Botryosphaeria dothidea TaxID=55169 RepID=A0A8H4IN25_9PEZI|nr:hypothetical protein GTA08_BOTSDO08426 [Botryosphaeria dothidea]
MQRCPVFEERERQLEEHCIDLADILWPTRESHISIGHWINQNKDMAILLVRGGRGRPFSISCSLKESRVEALMDLRRRLNLGLAAVRRNPRCNRIRIVRKG